MDKEIIANKAKIMPQQYEFSAEELISQAIDKGVSVETMEKLLAMRKELKNEWAKEQFDKAMSGFQGECPIIKKETKVDFTSKRTGNKTKYSYASLDSIIEQVKPILAKYGFSYDFDTVEEREGEQEYLVSICEAKHIAGHSKNTRFRTPIDREAFMNNQQKAGSANTFGKRYAFCNAFGIVTGDEDNDAVHFEEEEVEYIPTEYKSAKNTVTCPVCGKSHNGRYSVCFDCYKNGKKSPKKIDDTTKNTIKNQQERIKNLLSKMNRLYNKKTIKDLTQVEPLIANYPRIIGALEILVEKSK